jgi:hypothetical protein
VLEVALHCKLEPGRVLEGLARWWTRNIAGTRKAKEEHVTKKGIEKSEARRVEVFAQQYEIMISGNGISGCLGIKGLGIDLWRFRIGFRNRFWSAFRNDFWKYTRLITISHYML